MNNVDPRLSQKNKRRSSVQYNMTITTLHLFMIIISYLWHNSLGLVICEDKWIFILHITALDNRCQHCFVEVTKAIFFLYIEPWMCLLQDVLPSFM